MKSYVLIVLASLISISPNVYAKKKSVSIVEAKSSEIEKQLLIPARLIPGKMAHVLADFPSVVEKVLVNLGDQVDEKTQIAILKHSDPLFNERKIVVKSPIVGKIAKITVTESTQVARGEKIISIISQKGEKIIIEIPAKDLSIVKKDQSGILKIDNNEFKVKVAGVSPLVDSATGTASADVVFEDSETNRPQGVLGKVLLIAEKRTGILLPEHTISYQGRDTFVKKVIDNKISKVKISLGQRLRDQVEILEGVNSGDIIVERSSGFLADGAEVEVQGQEKKAEGI